ncbi:hypothetical protein QQS21_010068 [Conoideocrella luteorostrata]|uniref:Beta-lactamase-related domain-containing protein n=1 Tax=Conoideocrella luteorostrata TaxID=1105319 RepID=A0AAJ0CFV3_9HYPO|nr:hypothetical protein QQS21_010068 [Conoideocrella luteorostrata]
MATSAAFNRLRAAMANVAQICESSGVPGVSIGVIHHGATIFKHNHGYSHVEKPSSSDTAYGIGSITKSFISAAIAKLVDEKKLAWTTRVAHILPEFCHDSPIITDMTTITDILSHRCGLDGAGAMSLAFQGDGDMLLPKDSLFQLVNHFGIQFPFRQNWGYFVWGYSIAGAIIEKVTQKPLKDYLSEALFHPLGLKATSFSAGDFQPGELSCPHVGLSDGSAYALPKLQVFEGTFFQPSGGIYSTLNDQLIWASTMLRSIHGDGEGSLRTKEASYLFSNHISVLNPSVSERSYGLGWMRTQLPGVVGLIGDNVGLWELAEDPVMGVKEKPMLMIYHHGSTVGYHAFIGLFPDTNSAVVVLANSTDLSDAADWIGRVLIQALFEFDDGHDYVALAKEANRRTLAQFDELGKQIKRMRVASLCSQPRELTAFTGRYMHPSGLFFVDIFHQPPESDQLYLSFQGLKDQVYQLRHLCNHVFEWALTHDESKKRGRYNYTETEHYLFKFHVDGTDVVSFSWAIEETPAVFTKLGHCSQEYTISLARNKPQGGKRKISSWQSD